MSVAWNVKRSQTYSSKSLEYTFRSGIFSLQYDNKAEHRRNDAGVDPIGPMVRGRLDNILLKEDFLLVKLQTIMTTR